MPEATTSLHFASLTAASAAVHDGRPPLGDGVAGRARAIDAGGDRWVLRPTGPLFWSYLFTGCAAGRCVYRVVPAASTPAQR